MTSNSKLNIKTVVLWIIPFLLLGYVGEKLFPSASIVVINAVLFLLFVVLYAVYQL
ncbi:MAG: hypothetical protein GXO70_01175, partial [Acidobacteria bacterium]|nr:hypothetical protein [Acidobacteriota bacterium]